MMDAKLTDRDDIVDIIEDEIETLKIAKAHVRTAKTAGEMTKHVPRYVMQKLFSEREQR